MNCFVGVALNAAIFSYISFFFSGKKISGVRPFSISSSPSFMFIKSSFGVIISFMFFFCIWECK